MTASEIQGPLSVRRDADADWINHQVATRLFGATPRKIGRYAILETLGSGGMGLVYRADDRQLERTVAVKLLNADWSTPEGERRLQNEARAMARLSHPHVVQVYEVGHYREQVFLAMEFVEGQTLEAWLQRERSSGAILALFLSIGEGVAAAHEVGLIHRDLKPSNILVDSVDRPKVADFGLARHESRLDEMYSVTLGDTSRGGGSTDASGSLVGTPRYMAPEQHARQPATVWSDQFSFCMMLWEALCGEHAFAESIVSGTSRTFDWTLRPPPRGARMPGRIRRALVRGLQTDFSLRWPSMRELLAELGRPSWPRRHPQVSFITAIVLLIGIVGIAARMAMEPPPPGSEFALCESGQHHISEYARGHETRWRAALASQPHAPALKGFLEATIADWSDDAGAFCRRSALQPESPDLTRQRACLQYGADLLDIWVRDPSTLLPPELTPGDGPSAIAKPTRWAARTLQRNCPLTRDDSQGTGAASAPPLWTENVRGLTGTQALLGFGRPREALALLRSLEFAEDPPASLHLMEARALGAIGAPSPKVLKAFHAAEDAAELQHDDLGLLDARLEQAQLALDDWQRARDESQSREQPVLDKRWDRVLDTAETLLKRRGDVVDDDALRLRWLRAAFLAARGHLPEAASLRNQTIELGRQYASSRVLSTMLSEQAGHIANSAEAGRLDGEALRAAPQDDELRAYLNHMAGIRAFERSDLKQAMLHMHAAREHYIRAFGPETRMAIELSHATAQALYTAGESALALPDAEQAVAGYRRAQDPFQLFFSLYLLSAIHIRTGDNQRAVDEAKGALVALEASTKIPDMRMWRTIGSTGLVEALVANRSVSEALELAERVQHELNETPKIDISDQSDELTLARANAWVHLGRLREARAALARVREPGFLQENPFKRAEALALRASLAGNTRTDALALSREAVALYAMVGTDGGVRARRLKDSH